MGRARPRQIVDSSKDLDLFLCTFTEIVSRLGGDQRRAEERRRKESGREEI